MPDTTKPIDRVRRTPAPPRSMALYQVRVARVTPLSPHLRRVTFSGEDLGSLPFVGPDQRVKLLLPLPGQERPQTTGVTSVYDLLALPAETRPIIRTYTVRRHRPAAGEVDIDFAVHGELGPASGWAASTQPGEQAAIYGPASEYQPPEDTQWQLIVGDESALPAIGAIVESLRHYDRAQVVVELADRADTQQFDTTAEIKVDWLCRGAAPAQDSTMLLDFVRAMDLPAVPSYFWLAGESSVVTTLRRYLVNERGVAREDINFTGYWRHGHSENDA